MSNRNRSREIVAAYAEAVRSRPDALIDQLVSAIRDALPDTSLGEIVVALRWEAERHARIAERFATFEKVTTYRLRVRRERRTNILNPFYVEIVSNIVAHPKAGTLVQTIRNIDYQIDCAACRIPTPKPAAFAFARCQRIWGNEFGVFGVCQRCIGMPELRERVRGCMQRMADRNFGENFFRVEVAA